MKAQTRIVTVGTERFGAQWGVNGEVNKQLLYSSHYLSTILFYLYFIHNSKGKPNILKLKSLVTNLRAL